MPFGNFPFFTVSSLSLFSSIYSLYFSSKRLIIINRPEEKGLVDRGKLLTFHDRSPKPQLGLAKQWNINEYACLGGR